MKDLLIATGNPGKKAEYKQLFEDFDYSLVFLDRFSDLPEPEETEDSYQENACLKASFYGEKTTKMTLADDTGLEVEALPDQLGVKTKRYWQAAKPLKGYQQLLKDLGSSANRNARFLTVIAFFVPQQGIVETFKGESQGRIAQQAKGSNGFGYDPVFIPQGFQKTFAQMELEEKLQISSRGKSARRMIKNLEYRI